MKTTVGRNFVMREAERAGVVAVALFVVVAVVAAVEAKMDADAAARYKVSPAGRIEAVLYLSPGTVSADALAECPDDFQRAFAAYAAADAQHDEASGAVIAEEWKRNVEMTGNPKADLLLFGLGAAIDEQVSGGEGVKRMMNESAERREIHMRPYKERRDAAWDRVVQVAFSYGVKLKSWMER